MSRICISNCADDARTPVRATYVNLYKWPGSDAEFVRSAAVDGGGGRLHSRVAESISCRQMYLRSYTFSREETVPERTVKCFGKVRERIAAAAATGGEGRKRRGRRRMKRRGAVVRKMKVLSRGALRVVFRRMLLCTATVDVVHPSE